MTVPIAIVDVDCRLDPKLVQDWAEASNIFVNRDAGMAPPYGWGVSASIRVAPSLSDIMPGEWLCGLFSQPDVPGALGYHDVTPQGKPVLKCFPLLDAIENGCITITHELIEALADPLLSSASVGQDGIVRAREPGDPVEATSYVIKVSSGREVPVTNFVCPAYFEPPADLNGVPLDFLGLVKNPGDILPGGYQLVLDAGVWHSESNGELRSYRKAVQHVGRGARRKAQKR